MMLWERSDRHDSMEHFREYGDSFAGYPYLYYCRRCIRNFSTKVRVRMCNRCQNEDIVELPAGVNNVPLARMSSIKKEKFSFLNRRIFEKPNAKKEFEQAKKEFIASLQNIAKKYGAAFKRIKNKYTKMHHRAAKSTEELPSYS